MGAADRGREFAWIVGGAFARWGFVMEPHDDGTRLTETWEFTPDGLAMFAEKYGDRAGAEIDERVRLAHEGIPRTLAAIEEIAEGTVGGSV